jgi:hypothetical protein
MTDQAPPPPHDEEENEVLRAARELQAQKEAAEATEAADKAAAAKGGNGKKIGGHRCRVGRGPRRAALCEPRQAEIGRAAIANDEGAAASRPFFHLAAAINKLHRPPA